MSLKKLRILCKILLVTCKVSKLPYWAELFLKLSNFRSALKANFRESFYSFLLKIIMNFLRKIRPITFLTRNIRFNVYYITVMEKMLLNRTNNS